MLSDYHVHTEFSGDSTVTVKEQLEQAVALGMESVCITDHHDYDVAADMDNILDIKSYFSVLQQFKEQYKNKIAVRIGIELGLQTHLGAYFDELIRQYPFDFIIGSTHYVSGLDPYFPEFFYNKEEKQAYTDYFQAVLENLSHLSCYDVAGHIDYVVRYGPNKNKFYHYQEYCEVLDAILIELVRQGKGIECNTGGFRKNLGQPNPCMELIKRYREIGGEIITIGSDAHNSNDIGSYFDLTRQILLNCGFSYYTTFQGREPVFHKI